jgi:hypothetical protein
VDPKKAKSKVKSSQIKPKSARQIRVERMTANWFSAAENGDYNKMNQIISQFSQNASRKELKAFLHKRNRSGQTALMVAAQNGHTETVGFLLDTIDEIDTVDTCYETAVKEFDHLGSTALMLAAQFGHIATAELLLSGDNETEKLINLQQRNNAGEDALVIAHKNRHMGMASFLFSYFERTRAKVENKSHSEEPEEVDSLTIPFPASPRAKFQLPIPSHQAVIFRDMPELVLPPAPAAAPANASVVDPTEVVIRQFLGLNL